MSASRDALVELFSRVAPTYGAVGPPHFTYFARRLVDFVGVEPGGRVLDVATGTGTVLRSVAEQCGDRAHLVGIDLTIAMLERAVAEIRRAGLRRVTVCRMDAEQLAFADQSFDAVLCSFAFLALPDRPRALAEFRRVLAPAGRLGLLDAFGWFFQHDPRWGWQAGLLRSYGVLASDDVDQGSADELGTMLRDAGYSAVELAEDAYELVFRDPDEWWQWAWSHGSRRLFEAVAPARRAELKEQLFHGLASCRAENGLIHGTLRATLARARSPREPSTR